MRYLFPLNPYNQQRQYQKPVFVYPVHMAMYATYLRNQGHEVHWSSSNDLFDPLIDRTAVILGEKGLLKDEFKIIKDDFQIDIPFEKLPYPDRIFTDAKNKRWQSYGNYKYHPATHMMASNLCWYGKCTFCIDTAKLEAGEKRGVRSVDHVMEEIDDLISKGYREVFDDSGTFPVGKWLEEFCHKMNQCPKKQISDSLIYLHGNLTFKPKSYLGKRKDYIKIGCNMKPVKLDYKMLKDAGFRFILTGIESANQKTVDKIKKGQRSEDIIPIMKSMSDAGLEVHLTSMVGYEWETHEDAIRTVDLIYFLLRKGYIKTAQASVFMPPRTAPPKDHPAQKYVQKIYDVYKKPWYWWKKIMDIRHIEDITYLLKRLNHVKHAE